MAWNLDEKVTREDIAADRRRDFNKRQKSFMKIVGENLAAYACVLIFILLIGFIWTDIGLFVNITSFITDSLISVVLFVLADICMSHIGAKGGKLDEEYLKVHKEYLGIREEVRRAGLTHLDEFCNWQIDVEYDFYIQKQCKRLKIDYNEYLEKYQGKGLDELKTLLPIDCAANVFALGRARRIELSPDMLLTDGKVKSERGGLGISGEEYIEKHTTGWLHILSTALFAIVAAVPVFTLTQDASLGRVIYTVFKLSMMAYRMYQGYARGARGYNTIEPKHLQAKIRYLYLYLEFLNKKIYDQLDMSKSEMDTNSDVAEATQCE